MYHIINAIEKIASKITKNVIKNFAFAITVIAMCFAIVPITMYVYGGGEITQFIQNASLISGIVAVSAGIITAIMSIVIKRNNKTYVIPLERINQAYFTICMILVIAIEAIFAAYINWDYENFFIINPVTLVGLIAVALIPLGGMFQIGLRIADNIEKRKQMKKFYPMHKQ